MGLPTGVDKGGGGGHGLRVDGRVKKKGKGLVNANTHNLPYPYPAITFNVRTYTILIHEFYKKSQYPPCLPYFAPPPPLPPPSSPVEKSWLRQWAYL